MSSQVTAATPHALATDKWQDGLAASKATLSLVARTETEVTVPTEAPVQQSTIESELPDLAAIDTQSDDAALLAMQQDAEKKRKWATEAGSKLFALQTEFDKLQEMAAKNPDIVLSDAYRARDKAVREGITALGSVGDELWQRVAFSSLITEIRRCPATVENTLAVIRKVTGFEDRYALATLEEASDHRNGRRVPIGTFSFCDKVYVPKIFPDPCPGQKLLIWELTELVKRVKASVMKKRGGNRAASDILAGKKGIYYLYAEPRNGGKDGHALVEVYQTNPRGGQAAMAVRILEAVGRVALMANQNLGNSIPLEWVKEGKIISQYRLTRQNFDRALDLCKTLRSMIQAATSAASAQTTNAS